jgi:hypothetical protein
MTEIPFWEDVFRAVLCITVYEIIRPILHNFFRQRRR